MVYTCWKPEGVVHVYIHWRGAIGIFAVHILFESVLLSQSLQWIARFRDISWISSKYFTYLTRLTFSCSLEPNVMHYKCVHIKLNACTKYNTVCDVMVTRHFCDVIFAASFLQHHFCNVILIRRIILIFRFGQNHRHRPHSSSLQTAISMAHNMVSIISSSTFCANCPTRFICFYWGIIGWSCLKIRKKNFQKLDFCFRKCVGSVLCKYFSIFLSSSKIRH